MEKVSSAKKLAMIDALLRAQDMNTVAPGVTKVPIDNLSNAFSSNQIPANSYLPPDYFEKVTLPSALSTFKDANQVEEMSDVGLQDLIMAKDEPWVKTPAVVDPKPSPKRDFIEVDKVIRRKRINELLEGMNRKRS